MGGMNKGRRKLGRHLNVRKRREPEARVIFQLLFFVENTKNES